MSFTPRQGAVVVIAEGGVAVQVIPPGVNGGYIINPQSNTDQGISVPEPIYVDPTKAPDLQGNGTTANIGPGGSFTIIANSTLSVWVNAPTTGHKFTVVYW